MTFYTGLGLIVIAVTFAIMWLVDRAGLKSQEAFWQGEAGLYQTQADDAKAEAAYFLSELSKEQAKRAAEQQAKERAERDLVSLNRNFVTLRGQRDDLSKRLAQEEKVSTALAIGYTRAFALETPKMANIGKRFIGVLRRASREAMELRNG